jgi:hypothetical protein
MDQPLMFIMMMMMILQYYNLMGPSSYMRSVVDQNFFMRRMTVYGSGSKMYVGMAVRSEACDVNRLKHANTILRSQVAQYFGIGKHLSLKP